VGKSIAYNFKLRMTAKSLQMDGWMEFEKADTLSCQDLYGRLNDAVASYPRIKQMLPALVLTIANRVEF